MRSHIRTWDGVWGHHQKKEDSQSTLEMLHSQTLWELIQFASLKKKPYIKSGANWLLVWRWRLLLKNLVFSPHREWVCLCSRSPGTRSCCSRLERGCRWATATAASCRFPSTCRHRTATVRHKQSWRRGHSCSEAFTLWQREDERSFTWVTRLLMQQQMFLPPD